MVNTNIVTLAIIIIIGIEISKDHLLNPKL